MEGRFEHHIQYVLAAFISIFVYLVGGIDKLLLACAIFIGMDYITGIAAAAYRKELQSSKAWWGILRKVLTLCFVIIANQVDLIVGSSEHYMRNAMLMFIIASEGLSIIENLSKLGLPFPTFIVSALKNIKGEENKKED